MEAGGEFLVCLSRSNCESVVRVQGELDVAGAPKLLEAMDAAIASGAASCLIDLSEVTFIDTQGIRALLAGRHKFAAAGIPLTITRGGEQVCRAVHLLGLEVQIGWDDGGDPGVAPR